ncbi:WD40 repeat domain-containing protein [Oligoflexus tunisiensis]|uniref:WD40 repeat domain-containing protein n=1 Tax=Oligoflexus tunisiensis TaxID=708132 RepID=UPI00114CC8CB|nr:WD40 repeat domain-containing protein [Oligoflexus tunisiensis]
MKQHVNIFFLLLLVMSGCRQLTNRVQPATLECGEDFVANGRPWFRVETSRGTLLVRNEFEVIGLTDGTWQLQEVSSKGCFRMPSQSEWIVRSVAHKESRLMTTVGIVDSGGHRLQLEPNTSDLLKLSCPTKTLNSAKLTFEQIFKVEGSASTRLGVNYELYDANSEIPILQSNWLLGSQSLPLISGHLEDGSYSLKFKIQDLRQDQIRDHECKVELDNTPPEADLDRSHLILDTTEGKDYFVIPRQEQLRFKMQTTTKDDVRVEYCFLPVDESVASRERVCEPDQIRTAAVGEPISPSMNSGTWELHFAAIDVAGNRSDWKQVTPILYADSSAMQQIKLESRSEMLQTEIGKVHGIFDVLHKAFSNYSLWKSLATEFERNKVKDAIISLFYAAHIGMNNYSQFISIAGRTNNMMMTPDGEKLIAGLYDGDIQVFDLRSKKRISTLKGHWASASSFSLSPDNKILVSGNFDQTIKVWDLEQTKLLSEIPCCQGEFLRIDLSPDKKFIVGSSWNKFVKIWSIDGVLQKSISSESEQNFHQDVIMDLKISPDGKYFATGSWDRTVKLWDLTSGAFVRKMETDHADGVNAIEFSHDSRFLISAAKDGQILVHNVADGTLHKRLASLSASVTSIDVGAHRVIAGSLDNAIRV